LELEEQNAQDVESFNDWISGWLCWLIKWFLETHYLSVTCILSSNQMFCFHVPSTHWNVFIPFCGNCLFEAIWFQQMSNIPIVVKKERSCRCVSINLHCGCLWHMVWISWALKI
jgi:hypothetical protein